MKVLSFKHLTYSEVAKLIKKLMDYEGSSVSHMVSRVFEYVSKLSKCKEPEPVLNELTNLGLKEVTAVMLVNNCPNSVDEVRALLNFEEKTADDELLNRILEIVGKCCS